MSEQTPPIPDQEVYARLGEAGFARLVRAFYAQVPGDDILGPMYAKALVESDESMEHAEEKLREFLIQRFGGPQRYSQQRGHPRLRMRHARFVIDINGAHRWIMNMRKAMDEAGIDADVRRVLDPYFVQTAMHMVNADERG